MAQNTISNKKHPPEQMSKIKFKIPILLFKNRSAHWVRGRQAHSSFTAFSKSTLRMNLTFFDSSATVDFPAATFWRVF